MSRALCTCVIAILAVWPMREARAQAPLTLAEAMARAVREQPSLLADQLEVDARTAEVAQAGRWLNPSAALDVEDLGRSASIAGPSRPLSA